MRGSRPVSNANLVAVPSKTPSYLHGKAHTVNTQDSVPGLTRNDL
jgi:hypothetical protein